jgi:hypothetical protein
MVNPFEVLVSNLNALGFFGFLLPWVFIFVICYAILAKTKALGDDLRINAVLSIVLGFFVVGFGGPWLGSFFTTIFGAAAAILAGLLVLVLFFGMAGIPIEKTLSNKPVQAALIGIAIIIFAIAMGSWRVLVRTDVIAIVLVLVVLAAAVAFITKQ